MLDDLRGVVCGAEDVFECFFLVEAEVGAVFEVCLGVGFECVCFADLSCTEEHEGFACGVVLPRGELVVDGSVEHGVEVLSGENV